MVLSQNLTTITNTSYNSYTTTVSQTATSTLIRLNPFTVSGRSGRSCFFAYYSWDSTGFGGQELFGSVTSDNKIDFYIMTPQQYDDFKQGGGTSCSTNPSNGLVVASATSSYSLDWTLPAGGGTYYFVFYNEGSLDASVNFAAWTVTKVTATVQATSSILQTETHAATQPPPQTSATQSESTAAPVSPTGSDTFYVAVIAVVVVLAIIAVLALRRKGTKPAASTATRTAA